MGIIHGQDSGRWLTKDEKHRPHLETSQCLDIDAERDRADRFASRWIGDGGAHLALKDFRAVIEFNVIDKHHIGALSRWRGRQSWGLKGFDRLNSSDGSLIEMPLSDSALGDGKRPSSQKLDWLRVPFEHHRFRRAILAEI